MLHWNNIPQILIAVVASNLLVTWGLEFFRPVSVFFFLKLLLDLFSGPFGLLGFMVVTDGFSSLKWVVLNPIIFVSVASGLLGVPLFLRGKRYFALVAWIFSGIISIFCLIAQSV